MIAKTPVSAGSDKMRHVVAGPTDESPLPLLGNEDWFDADGAVVRGAADFATNLKMEAALPVHVNLEGEGLTPDKQHARVLRARAAFSAVNRSLSDAFTQFLRMLEVDKEGAYLSSDRGMLIIGDPGLGKTEMGRVAAEITGGDHIVIDVGAQEDASHLFKRYAPVVPGSGVDIFERYVQNMPNIPKQAQDSIIALVDKIAGLETITVTGPDGEEKKQEVSRLRPVDRKGPHDNSPQRWMFHVYSLDNDKKLELARELAKSAQAQEFGIQVSPNEISIVETPGPLLQALLDVRKARDDGKRVPTIIVLDEYLRVERNANALHPFINILKPGANKVWEIKVDGQTHRFTNDDLREMGVAVLATGNHMRDRGTEQRDMYEAEKSRFTPISLDNYARNDFVDGFLRKVGLPIATIGETNESLNEVHGLTLPTASLSAPEGEKERFGDYLTLILNDRKAALHATGNAASAWDQSRHDYVAKGKWQDTLAAAENVGAFMMAWRNFEKGFTEDGRNLPETLKPNDDAVDMRVLVDQILSEAMQNPKLSGRTAALTKAYNNYVKENDLSQPLGTRIGLAVLERVKTQYLKSSKQEEYKYLINLMDKYGLLPEILLKQPGFWQMLSGDTGAPGGISADAAHAAGAAPAAKAPKAQSIEELLNIKQERGRFQDTREWQVAIAELLQAKAERTGEKDLADTIAAMKDGQIDTIVPAGTVDKVLRTQIGDKLLADYQAARQDGGDLLSIGKSIGAQLLVDAKFLGVDKGVAYRETVSEGVDIRDYGKGDNKIGQAAFDAVERTVQDGQAKHTDFATDTRQVLITAGLSKEVALALTHHLCGIEGFTGWRENLKSAEAVKIAENRPNDGDLAFTTLRMADEKGKPAYLFVMRQGDDILMVGDVAEDKFTKLLDGKVKYFQRSTENRKLIQNTVDDMLHNARARAVTEVGKQLTAGGEGAQALLNELTCTERGKLVEEWKKADEATKKELVEQLGGSNDAATLGKLMGDDASRIAAAAAKLVEERSYDRLIVDTYLHRCGPTEEARKKAAEEAKAASGGTDESAELAQTDESMVKSKSLSDLLVAKDAFRPEIPVAELNIAPSELLKDERYKHQYNFLTKTLAQPESGQALSA